MSRSKYGPAEIDNKSESINKYYHEKGAHHKEAIQHVLSSCNLRYHDLVKILVKGILKKLQIKLPSFQTKIYPKIPRERHKETLMSSRTSFASILF